MDSVTDRMRHALNHYRANGYANYTKAYIAAGYSTKGKPSSVKKLAEQLFDRPKMQAEIDRMQKEDYEASTDERARIFEEWKRAAKVSEEKNDRGNWIRANDSQAKALGMFNERSFEGDNDRRSQEETMVLIATAMLKVLEPKGVTLDEIMLGLKSIDTTTATKQ